jgi:isoaspartyl peptidase/L-asparaginase-like protein (Ntn-hydrolase superfamily)
MMGAGYSLMVHGGAGVLAAADDPVRAQRYLDGLQAVLETRDPGAGPQYGRALRGATEDDPLFNAGRGSVLHRTASRWMPA